MKKITCLALFGRFPWPAIGGTCLALPFKTCFKELNCCLSLTTEQVHPFSFICLSKAVILFSRLSGSKLSPCSFLSRLKSARAVLLRSAGSYKRSRPFRKILITVGELPRVNLIWHYLFCTICT